MVTSPEIAAFIDAVRRTVEPVEFMTDEQLRATSLPPPIIRLLLSLRESLRDYDAVADAIGEIVVRDGKVVAVATDPDRELGEQVRRDEEERVFGDAKRKHGGDE